MFQALDTMLAGGLLQNRCGTLQQNGPRHQNGGEEMISDRQHKAILYLVTAVGRDQNLMLKALEMKDLVCS